MGHSFKVGLTDPCGLFQCRIFSDSLIPCVGFWLKPPSVSGIRVPSSTHMQHDIITPDFPFWDTGAVSATAYCGVQVCHFSCGNEGETARSTPPTCLL